MDRLRWVSGTLTQSTPLLAEYLQPLFVQVLGLALLIFAGTPLQLLNSLVICSFIDTAGGARRNLLFAAAASLSRRHYHL